MLAIVRAKKCMPIRFNLLNIDSAGTSSKSRMKSNRLPHPNFFGCKKRGFKCNAVKEAFGSEVSKLLLLLPN